MTTPENQDRAQDRARLIAQKLFSRKFIMALFALVATITESDLDPRHLGVIGAVAIVYVIAEAFVDRRRLEQAITVGTTLVEAGLEAGRSQGESLSRTIETINVLMPRGATPNQVDVIAPDGTTVPGGAWSQRDDGRWVLAVQRVLTLVAIALMVTASTACGASQMTNARTVLSMSGQGVVAVERTFQPEYEAAGERVRAEVQTFQEYVERMHRWIVAASSIQMTAAAIRLAETQLDLIEQGAAGDVMNVLACVGVSLSQLLDVLTVVIRVPDTLVAIVRMVGGVTGDRCNPAAVPTFEPPEPESASSPTLAFALVSP